MMPMTPSGTRTRWMRRPFGRVHSASTVPTGSGSAAMSSTPRAIASTRAASSCSRSSIARAESGGRRRAHVARVGGEDLGLARAQRAPPIACSARLRCSPLDERQHALRRDRVAADAAASVCAMASSVVTSAPGRRGGSSRRGHDSRESPRAPGCGGRTMRRGVLARVGAQAARDLGAVRVAHDDRVAAVEAALDPRDAGRQQALAAAQRLRRAGVDVQRARGLAACPRSTACARSSARPAPGTRCSARRPRCAAADAARDPRRCTCCSPPRPRSCRRALGGHAAGTHVGGRAARHRLDLGRDAGHSGMNSRLRVARRIGGVEAVDVGQQHQAVGARHLRDARGQPVVVAVADLGGGHGVVLVDDRDRAELAAACRACCAR